MIPSLGNASITIKSGTVEAVGEHDGAGIGTGQGASTGIIRITGGSVTARGGYSGAGIGGGYMTAGGNITIIGGTVTASGVARAIGAGSSGSTAVNFTGPSGSYTWRASTANSDPGVGFNRTSSNEAYVRADNHKWVFIQIHE